MFYKILIALFVISFFWALLSLRKINNKPDINNVKKKLNKSRVVFQGKSGSS